MLSTEDSYMFQCYLMKIATLFKCYLMKKATKMLATKDTNIFFKRKI